GARHVTALGVLALIALTGCGSAAAPASPAPAVGTSGASASAAGSPAAWDQVLAAAKKEGQVNLVTMPGEGYRQVWDPFQAKYGIKVELLSGNGGADLAPKLQAERKAGQFNWDVMIHSPSTGFQSLKPVGALTALQPNLILPEVLDDKKWIGGFAAGWADHDRSTVYFLHSQEVWTAYVNRAVVPESQLSKIDQLWDAKWKGKIALLDPRPGSAGASKLATLLATYGEDRLRALLRDQSLVLTQDRRQLGDWLIRGQYAIALGFTPDVLINFKSEGVDVSQIKPLDTEALAGGSLTHGAVAAFDQPPHPNAAKVAINWLMSQEGQTSWSRRSGFNSRRTDVAVVDPDGAVDGNKKYIDLQTEDSYDTQLKAIAISKEELK